MEIKNSYETKTINEGTLDEFYFITEPEVAEEVDGLLFGVDTAIETNDLLQNNIDEFEWIVRNKVYPNFCGRYLTGENCLTKEEIKYIHTKGCRVAAIYADDGEKKTEEQGMAIAKKVNTRAIELGIPSGTAIFLEIGENEKVTRVFMRGFAKALMNEGYTPGFKVNTDAKYTFDREFSRGVQNDEEVFKKCLIWAVAPTVKEYNKITTSHRIQPEYWRPYAPSGITRNTIAIWQYGVNCHPIADDTGKITTFNLDLVRNKQVILDKMF